MGRVGHSKIISATAAADTSAAANHTAPLLSLAAMTGMIAPLKWLHLCLVCGVATNAGVPEIWGKVVATPTNQGGLAVLSQ